jgi:steroid delta-isomerase-like uncharacterized protein
MSSEEYMAMYRRLFEEGFSQGNLAIIDELIAPEHISQARNVAGRERLKQLITMFRSAFPDLRFTVEDLFVKRDKVVVRWIARGTHQGRFLDVAPTGKQLKVAGITIGRIEGGKIVEEWCNWDALGLILQLGLIPQSRSESTPQRCDKL